MTAIIVYLIGVLLAYVLLRRYFDEHSWRRVIFTAVCSIGSWVSVIAIAIIYLFEYLAEKISDSEPPKWL